MYWFAGTQKTIYDAVCYLHRTQYMDGQNTIADSFAVPSKLIYVYSNTERPAGQEKRCLKHRFVGFIYVLGLSWVHLLALS